MIKMLPQKIKKICVVILIAIGGLFVTAHAVLMTCLLVMGIANLPTMLAPRGYYVTNDIEDYGEYIGIASLDQEKAAKRIEAFFPKEIDDSFSDITYSYKAENYDSLAYEAYLEFVIEDEDEYKHFVSQYTEGLEARAFEHDSSFTEYSIKQRLSLDVEWDGEGECLFEDMKFVIAEIDKILCSDKEQRIVFVSLAVFDGGVARVDFLSTYFTRFGIDPLEYADNVYYINER